MKSVIVVRKNKAERICVSIFAMLSIFLPTLYFIMKSLDFKSIIILLSLPYMISLLLMIYYLSWNIKIDKYKNEIKKSVFFIEGRSRSCYEIKWIVIKYSYTQHEYVEISFQKGNTLDFRMCDENAKDALNKLRMFCLIKRM